MILLRRHCSSSSPISDGWMRRLPVKALVFSSSLFSLWSSRFSLPSAVSDFGTLPLSLSFLPLSLCEWSILLTVVWCTPEVRRHLFDPGSRLLKGETLCLFLSSFSSGAERNGERKDSYHSDLKKGRRKVHRLTTTGALVVTTLAAALFSITCTERSTAPAQSRPQTLLPNILLLLFLQSSLSLTTCAPLMDFTPSFLWISLPSCFCFLLSSCRQSWREIGKIGLFITLHTVVLFFSPVHILVSLSLSSSFSFSWLLVLLLLSLLCAG